MGLLPLLGNVSKCHSFAQSRNVFLHYLQQFVMPVHSSLVVTHYTVRRMEKTEEPIMGGQCVIDEQLIIDIL